MKKMTVELSKFNCKVLPNILIAGLPHIILKCILKMSIKKVDRKNTWKNYKKYLELHIRQENTYK